MYFVHSLYPVPIDKSIVAAQTEYGTTFTSAVASKNIYGTQFHPEKSGDLGLKILKNFAKTVTSDNDAVDSSNRFDELAKSSA